MKKTTGFEKLNKKGQSCVMRALHTKTMAISIPKSMHVLSETSGGSGIVSKNPQGKGINQKVSQDVGNYRRLLKGQGLTPKEKEVMDNIPQDCKKNIEKGLKKVEKKKHNATIKTAFEKCKKNQDKKSSKKKRRR